MITLNQNKVQLMEETFESAMNLPEGWAECQLRDVIYVQNGYAFPSEDYRDTGVPLIRQTNLAGDKLLLEKCVFLDPSYLQSKKDFVLRKGDILVGMSGSLGKICIYDLDYPALQNQRTGRIVPYSEDALIREYFYYFLQTVKNDLQAKGKGLGVSNISASDIETLSFRLAPITEQKRIVVKVKELLIRVNTAKGRLAKVSVILKRFRQAVLAAACSGRLTADWRENNSDLESAGALLENIQKRRLQQANTASQKQKINEIYSYKEEGDSNLLPESWKYFASDKLCESFQYGTSKKSEPSGKVAVLRMGNIKNGEIDWNDLAYTSDNEEIEKYRLNPGDVLFNRTNSPELVGKTGIYRGKRPAIFAGYLIKINNFEELDSRYLNFCLNTIYAKDFCLQVKTDGVSQSNINAQKLGKFEVPFCPPQEQKEIVRRIDALFNLANNIERRVAMASTRAEKLTQAILAKAFRGELVPTEAELARRERRSYESASDLLARIKSERETIKASTTGHCRRVYKGQPQRL